ncbi:MAG: homocysteine S-methyltransferase family protein, partial [Clostridia bacterium]|nr:homocysteine S-methyltransferase family protein [Clostridia bacterium]
KYSEEELDEIIKCAIANCRKAIDECGNSNKHFVALDIGPLGKLLKPLGTLDFEDAVSIFAKTVEYGQKYGADLILIETMNDLYETKAAVLAAKENSDLPIFVTNAYDKSGKLMTGASPEAVCATLEGLGVDAIGMNCSFGPQDMIPILEKLVKVSSTPIIVNPNAGLPVFKDGKTSYDIDEMQFAEYIKKIANMGACVVGGCCGTTPEYIGEVTKRLSGFTPKPLTKKNLSVISSYTHAVNFGDKCVIIGERINPTGKKVFKEALRNNDIDYILNVGLDQENDGAHVLDVNVGLPEIDETDMLSKVVFSLQSVTGLPLQIDTSDAQAMEKAMRLYNGKPMVNSVNGKKESMEAIFPLIKKYGGLVVALTLDENGIPSDSEGRCKIAERIIETAKEYGIDKKDIIVDTLAMTISTDSNAAVVTLDSLEKIKKMGINTSLGVSNVSFGLPAREIINSTFFATALAKGLSGAIINPHSAEMMKVYKSYCALSGYDENCNEYIEFSKRITVSSSLSENTQKVHTENEEGLKGAIIKGLKESAYKLSKDLLATDNPLDIINTQIVPALDAVGKGFEEKTVFLPQLLISAEAAKSAFDAIKEKMAESGNVQTKKCPVVIATVKGDIHDIGKNIVKALLENYGFDVSDLGKDVEPMAIIEEAKRKNAPLIGLSALMTTTVPAMEETVKLAKEIIPDVKIMVGGAVLTKEYADRMGADMYCKDAMESVRYAEEINGQIQ